MSDAELSGRADELTRAVTDLGDGVTALMSRIERTEGHSRRSRRLIRWTIAGVVLDVVLTVVIVLLFNHERELAAVQERTNSEVLCPLYGVFLNSYNTAQRDALPIDQQKRYDDTFAVIKRGAQALGCPLQR